MDSGSVSLDGSSLALSVWSARVVPSGGRRLDLPLCPRYRDAICAAYCREAAATAKGVDAMLAANRAMARARLGEEGAAGICELIGELECCAGS